MTQTPDGTIRFEPQPSRDGRGLRFGLVMAVVALGYGFYQLATGRAGDPLTWIALVVGVLMIAVAVAIARTDTTPLSFLVGPDGVGRDAPAKTAFTLPWRQIGTSRLVHEHHNNTVWFEFAPAQPRLYERHPEIGFFKHKAEDADAEVYRVLVNDGTDQMDAVDAALRRFGGRRYAGRTAVTLREDQERRRRNRRLIRRER